MQSAARQRRELSGRVGVWVVGGVAAVATVVVALAGGGGVAGAASGPCGATGVLSGSGPFTCTYSTVGSDTFTVPAVVTSASFDVVGAVGGNYFIDGDAAHPDPAGAITGRGGGGGGGASGTLGLTPGSVLQVDVAGAGATGTAASRSGGMNNGPSGGSGALGGFGGSNGGVAGGPGDASGGKGGTAFDGGNGGGGGGSSDVRIDPAGCVALTCGLGDRVLVGAGGGASGGTGGSGNALGGTGGNGGGATGAPGGSTVDGGNAGVSGGGGTRSAGGAGGFEPGLNAPGAISTDPRYGGNGGDGESGVGGAGGHGNLPCTGTQTPPCTSSGTTSGGGAGGGAGGGYFGGGGGSGGGGLFGGGGGAGGGGGGASSFVTASATSPVLTDNANANTSAVRVNTDGTETDITNGSVNSGNGQVTITWNAPSRTTPSLSGVASRSLSAGGQISDSATLSGGSAPTGTITFKLFGPGDSSCTTPLASSTAAVAGNASYESAPFTTAAAGTYTWIARYGGDGANAPAATACGAAGQSVVVTAAPVTPRIRVRAASSLGAALRAIDPTEQYSLGDSDFLARSLARGAAADVFAGVDDADFRSLVRLKRIAEPVAIATTRLVLIVPRGGKHHVRELSDLTHRGVRFLVATSGVSFGAEARSVLSRLHLTRAVKHAAITRDTPAQIAAQVAAGKVDAAFVYATDLTRGLRRELRILTIPAAGDPTVTYDIAVVTTSQHHAAAAAYIAKVLAPAGQAALRRLGFGKR